MGEDSSGQDEFRAFLQEVYDQGRVDAIATIEQSLINVSGHESLDGDKAVGFSHAILLVSDTYDLLGLERPV